MYLHIVPIYHYELLDNSTLCFTTISVNQDITLPTLLCEHGLQVFGKIWVAVPSAVCYTLDLITFTVPRSTRFTGLGMRMVKVAIEWWEDFFPQNVWLLSFSVPINYNLSILCNNYIRIAQGQTTTARGTMSSLSAACNTQFLLWIVYKLAWNSHTTKWQVHYSVCPIGVISLE